MKTPREILLERHLKAEPKLNAIRHNALMQLAGERRLKGEMLAKSAWERLVSSLLSLRWHLAALSAAWLAIVLLNIDHPAAPSPVTAKQSIPAPRQLLLALRENRRQLLQLLEPPVTERASRPPSRSQVSSTLAVA